MWAVGYVGRLPHLQAPPALLGVLFLLLYLAAGGAVKALGGDWRKACAVGFFTSLINLLILGSLLAEKPGPNLAYAVPGALLAGAVLVAVGFFLIPVSPLGTPFNGEAWFARVVVAACFLLVVAGGLVTSQGAGLAVPDWPNTFGTNMFLFPLSRMTGGIYYEHAHRLFGSLVGLATLSLALYLGWSPQPRWVKRWGWVLFLLVAVQGLLGGLRVTGKLTTAQDPTLLAPSLPLAVAHGVLGQLLLSGLVALAAVLSPGWRARAGVGERLLWPGVLWALLVVQLVAGAVQRHLSQGLLLHISLASLILLVALLGGAALALKPPEARLGRWGRLLVGLVCLQFVLGFATFWHRGFPAHPRAQSVWEVVLATAHQAGGALLLALATLLVVWSWPSRVHR